MIVQANSHLGFVCHDLDKSVQFYEEILGCKEKSQQPPLEVVVADFIQLRRLPANFRRLCVAKV